MQNPTLYEIKSTVADHYKLPIRVMAGEARYRAIARPRQVAMYLCRQLTKRSLPEIGRAFGGRDHTTVMYSCRKVEELMLDRPAFKAEVDDLSTRIRGVNGTGPLYPEEAINALVRAALEDLTPKFIALLVDQVEARLKEGRGD